MNLILMMDLTLVHLMLDIWSWYVWGESISVWFDMPWLTNWPRMPTYCSIVVPIVDIVLFNSVKPALNSLSLSYIFSRRFFIWSQDRHEISAMTDSWYWVSQPFYYLFHFSAYFSHLASVLLLLCLLAKFLLYSCYALISFIFSFITDLIVSFYINKIFLAVSH